jgi:hypothetical protein
VWGIRDEAVLRNSGPEVLSYVPVDSRAPPSANRHILTCHRAIIVLMYQVSQSGMTRKCMSVHISLTCHIHQVYRRLGTQADLEGYSLMPHGSTHPSRVPPSHSMQFPNPSATEIEIISNPYRCGKFSSAAIDCNA